jgi:hypothetical protein
MAFAIETRDLHKSALTSNIAFLYTPTIPIYEFHLPEVPMKQLIAVSFLVSMLSVNSFGSENIHRLGGYYTNQGKKFAVCISLFENFWFSRGVKAYSGYMTYAIDYINDVPLSPPGFALAGNVSNSTNEVIIAIFDQNNPSSENPDLMVGSTKSYLKGKDLTSLSIDQGGTIIPLILKELSQEEECSLSRP